MGFFDALRRVLEAERGDRGDRGDPRLAETGGFDDSAHPEFPEGRAVAADPEVMAAPPETVAYDRDQWRRKLKRVLERLPTTEAEWGDLTREAGALGFETAWVEQCMREEFTLMVRRAIADRAVTLAEHRKLELARSLIGLPEAEAERVLHDIVAEAEGFFGATIAGVHPAEARADDSGGAAPAAEEPA